MRNLLLMALLCLGFTACQEATTDDAEKETMEVDVAAIEKQAGELMDRYYDFHKHAGDPAYLNGIVAEDVLIMGTDPAEVYGKDEMVGAYAEYLKDPVLKEMMNDMEFNVTDRKVMVAEDGSQAIVVDLVNVSFTSLPMRVVTVIEKMGDDWKMTFSSAALLVNNNDLPRIDALLAASSE